MQLLSPRPIYFHRCREKGSSNKQKDNLIKKQIFQIKIYTDSPVVKKIQSEVNSNNKTQTNNISKFNPINKKLDQLFENITLRGSPHNSSTNVAEWDSSIHRSPSPISGSMDKIKKLRGIGNLEYDQGNKNPKNNDKTLFASRNYLIHGKSYCFQ